MRRLGIALVALGVVYTGIGVAQSTSDEAQQTDAILVLDGSGSMWGQVDGRYKISIARDVIGDLLDRLPEDHRLGLMAYGHNRKGDCTDIEMISNVGADRESIRKAVNNLKPLGKTPLSASVKQAAEVLRYRENSATVILVSDGEETCDIDPCELGRSLESSGVDFTAHVIGFDLSTDVQRSQLQCLAQTTGGTYNDAANADELSDALQETIATTPVEQAADTLVYLRASDLDDGPIIKEGLRWKITATTDGKVVHESSADEGELQLQDLAQGRYSVAVNRPADGAADSAEFFIYKGNRKTLTLSLEIPLQASVRTEPEGSAPAGSEILVYWEGPERKNDWIGLAEVGAPESKWLAYKYTKTGNPVTLKMPIELGEYEIRYVVGRPVRQLASTKITSTSIGAAVSSATEATAGTMLDVTWTGPDYKNDWIGIVKPKDENGKRTAYTYTKRGSPLQIQTPIEPGEYEIRYITAQGGRILARQLVTINDVSATLQVPDTAAAGSTFDVTWTGPNYKNDWLGTFKPGAAVSGRETYAYPRNGSPLPITAPPVAGNYLVKYITQKQRVLAEAPIEVTAVTATVSASASAPAGTMLSVDWTGPDYKNDYVTLAKAGAKVRGYVTYQYTKDGSPLELELPEEQGNYEVRYIQTNGNIILARQAIEVK